VYQIKIKTSVKSIWFSQSCIRYPRSFPTCWINKDDASPQHTCYSFILSSQIWQICAL